MVWTHTVWHGQVRSSSTQSPGLCWISDTESGVKSDPSSLSRIEAERFNITSESAHKSFLWGVNKELLSPHWRGIHSFLSPQTSLTRGVCVFCLTLRGDWPAGKRGVRRGAQTTGLEQQRERERTGGGLDSGSRDMELWFDWPQVCSRCYTERSCIQRF